MIAIGGDRWLINCSGDGWKDDVGDDWWWLMADWWRWELSSLEYFDFFQGAAGPPGPAGPPGVEVLSK